MSTSTTPLKYASDIDYTPSVIIFTSVLLILSTLAICARCYARWAAKNVPLGIDDGLAVLGWLGFLGNLIANYLLAVNHAVSTTPPTAEQGMVASKAIASVGVTYTTAVVASKLSLLFLFRRIFSMRTLWFRISWYIIFVLIFPISFAVAITWWALGIAGLLSFAVELTYAIYTVTIVNTTTDVCMLILPIGMTANLQLSGKQRALVMFIFALGSAGTIISLVRCVQAFLAQQQNWDPRYQLYIETMMGAAEAGSILICACLPVMRPLFVSLKNFTTSHLSSFTRTMGTMGTKQSHVTLTDGGDNDEMYISLKENVIHRRVDVDVESNSRDGSVEPSYSSRPAKF